MIAFWRTCSKKFRNQRKSKKWKSGQFKGLKCFLRELEEIDCEKFTKLLIEQFEQEENNKKISPKQLKARIRKRIKLQQLTTAIAKQGRPHGRLSPYSLDPQNYGIVRPGFSFNFMLS